MNNFSVNVDGSTYWISRHMAVAGFVFTKRDEVLYVLANKRGLGCPTDVGKWNCPCGYLDFNETILDAVIRETKEETGLAVDNFKLFYINDSPLGSRQNVTFRHVALVDYKPIDSFINNSTPEDDEVECVSWIPVRNVDALDWAFNHGEIIKEYAKSI